MLMGLNSVPGNMDDIKAYVLYRFGIKTAVASYTATPYQAAPSSRFKYVDSPGAASSFFSNIGSRVKRELVGDPSLFMQQAREKTLLAPHGVLRNAFRPKGALHAALMYGLPVVGALPYLMGEFPQKRRALGQLVGGTVGSIAGSPMGILGSMAGGHLGGTLGGYVGGELDKDEAN